MRLLHSRPIAITLVLVALMASCAIPPSSSPSAPAPLPVSAAPSATPPRWLATVRAIWTEETPTETVTQTPAGTPTSDLRPLSQGGPWIAFASDDGLWVADARSGVVKLVYSVSSPPYRTISFSGSSHRGALAFAEPPPRTEYTGSGDPIFNTPAPQPESSLLVVYLPSTTFHQLSPLLAPIQALAIATQFPFEQGIYGWYRHPDAWYLTEQIRAAYGRPGSLAWSPDGSKLAFTASIDGPTSDLYLFDSGSGRLSRLSSGPTQAASPIWSPDGRFVVHKAVEDFNTGERNGTDIVSGLWSAAADGSSVTLLANGDIRPVAWLSPSDLLVHHWVFPCDSFDLAVVNVATGRSRPLWQGSFEAVAADPLSGAILLGNPYAGDDICPSTAPLGLFLIRADGTPPTRIAEYDFTPSLYYRPSIEWSEPLGLFNVQGIRMYTTEGQLSTPSTRTRLPWASVATSDAFCNTIWSPDHSMFALSDDSNLYLAQAPAFSPQVLSRGHSGLCANGIQWVVPSGG